MTKTRFCILASQRTGSSYLKTALDSHPEIHCMGEIFHSQRADTSRLLLSKLSETDRDHIRSIKWRNQAPVEYLNYVMTQCTSQFPDINSFGFKLFTTHNCEAWDEVLRSDYVKILLYRENKLDQYASHKIASSTGLYASEKIPETAPIKVPFILEEFNSFLKIVEGTLEQDIQRIKQGNVPFFLIEYQQIATLDFAPILKALGVDSTYNCHSNLKKQDSRPTLDKFSNVDDLKRAFCDTPYEHWLIQNS